ncbi:MAG: DUF305 domain-containing protein [Cyanobacteriota bacterium]
MRSVLGSLALIALLAPAVRAQPDPHGPHQHHLHGQPDAAVPAVPATPADPTAYAHHAHDVGPAGSTYDLRWIDGMVQHHTGALRMSEFVFDIGVPGVGALGKEIWRDQAQEIKAMLQWRKAWYPRAPVVPVVLRPDGDPNAMADLIPMGPAQMEAMRMVGAPPTRETRVTWFLEGMLQHHGGALIMAHDALKKTANPTLRRLARQIIVAQRKEILQLRRMLGHDGLDKPEYYVYDKWFALE